MQESSASMQQKLLEFEDEVKSERHLLEEELNGTMKELNKLHAKEKKAEKLVKRLEQEMKSQSLELTQMEEELKGFVKETWIQALK